ncbi:hypothetical protein [Cypionkella sp.]|uniref:hypothetical protein n=1 Tax=Cypionkella sp. TaxID=2811411 RepID=UPI002722F68C|nr:hypothetical protein [Cypionkella sp.]MDO8985185.1 hypothetical protein [Cypionkella sp.]MDP1578170.1 hypothetical protein [Cypionkella sp.]MDP2051685.1 hypothetical protein [Cypionkella sp.]
MTATDTAPLTAEVGAITVDALSSAALWAAGSNHGGVLRAYDRAANMLTTFASPLAERHAELAPVSVASATLSLVAWPVVHHYFCAENRTAIFDCST